MEREGHPASAAAPTPIRRWAEDVIVLSSGRPSAEAADLPPPEKLYYKTKLCDKYETSGRCTYEDGCTFAHGRAELRPPVPPLSSAPPHGFGGGVWRRPPGPDQDHRGGGYGGGKVCHNFRDKGSCHFGDKCAFPHASPAPGAQIRGPGGEQKLAADARRSATPGTAPPRYVGAPPAPGRAFPPVPGKATVLEQLALRKTSGIYGDWPEQYSS
ncbi:zinc finger CCCH domain-containing protein 1-like [Lolium perenne]|uniref:zinc finger CCCH domain-containing protein 1-like n=1 Tax=Lolium perenne TaxID=4522 RepID=UPI0021EB2690|nr:zinc finger CCCH domain-containing protein 1-like [Lolium perenne]